MTIRSFIKDTVTAFILTLTVIFILIGMDHLADKIGGWGHLMILALIAAPEIVAIVAYTHRKAHR